LTDVADYERQFRRAGLPLFIEDYTASEDVFTRAVPVLAFMFIAEMLGAIQLDWSPVANVAAALGGLAILVGTFALLNGLRGRRRLALPERIGRTELVLFVLLPPAALDLRRPGAQRDRHRGRQPAAARPGRT
jgi:hypothetical protein